MLNHPLRRRSDRRTPVSAHGTTPDSHVTIRCAEEDLDLEVRTELLAWAFAKTVQGAKLERIELWDLRNGIIKFIVSGAAAVPEPRGRFMVDFDDWPMPPEQEWSLHEGEQAEPDS